MNNFPLFPLTSVPQENAYDYFLQNHFCRHHLKKGDLITSLTENTVGYIVSGRLKVYMSDENGEERLMWFLNATSTLHTSMLDLFSKKIVVDRDCELLYIPLDQYYDFIMLSKENLERYHQSWRQRYGICVQHCLSSYRQTSKQNARIKVCKFIQQMMIYLGHQRPSDDAVVIQNVPSRADIASLIGVHQSNVISYISELEKMGILEKNKSDIIIIAPEKLERLLQTLDVE